MEGSQRPRLIAPIPTLDAGADRWRDRLKKIEDLGFDEGAISEHYSFGWGMEPLAALAFAAASTTRLRLLTLVLNNDIRHPAIVAKAIATLDVLSEGRVTLGIGAGWLQPDYSALGIPFDSVGTRIARLEEAVVLIRAFFDGGTVNARGRFYEVDELEALPHIARKPGPPILIGAGGPRMLDLAGRMADIVGVNVTLGTGGFDQAAARELSGAAIRAKIARVRSAAHSAGRPMPTLELTPAVVVVDGDRSSTLRLGFTDYIEDRAAEFEDSPAVLVGSAEHVAESVQRWTDELGVELWHLGSNLDAGGRVIAALGR